MFHLSDDTVVTILSFSDPFSLASFEATSRRSHRLVQSAWIVQDEKVKKREGGSTPRQRVISSFAIHRSCVLSRLSQLVENSSWSDLSKRGITMLPWDELDGGKHLIHLRVSGHSPFQTYCESIITIGPEQLPPIGEKGNYLAEVPLAIEQFESTRSNGIKDILDRLYASEEGTSENKAFRLEGKKQTIARIGAINRQIGAISVVVFDRQTLAPSILFKEGEGSTRTTRVLVVSGGGSLLFMANTMEKNVVDSDDSISTVSRYISFHFANDSFKLLLTQEAF